MAITVASYNKKYLRMKPEVSQIFADLEEFKDYVRMQYPQVAFNEADLYKNSSPIWQKFLRSKNRAPHNNGGPRHNPAHKSTTERK
jgi:hypothetical protein